MTVQRPSARPQDVEARRPFRNPLIPWRLLMASLPTVLVVEDEALLREMVVQHLEELGHTVLQAGTGDAALALLDAGRPVDILFTDIRMPGVLDGWTLAERYRALNPEGGVIYATGYSPVAARQVRGGLFFAKPYRTGDIVKALAELAAAGARSAVEGLRKPEPDAGEEVEQDHRADDDVDEGHHP